MSGLVKIALFLLVFAAATFAGYRAYRNLNRRIRDAESGLQLLLFSLLLIIVLAALFTGAIFAIIYGYEAMSDQE